MSNREDTTVNETNTDQACTLHGIRRCTICAPSIPPGVGTYSDALGRQQWRAVGPNGTFLITRAAHTWEVWRSDSLNTIARSRVLEQALKDAVYYANVGH